MPFVMWYTFLQTKSGMGELMNNAIFSMTEAKFAMGDFNQMVLNSTDKAQLKARARRDNVAGIFAYVDARGLFRVTLRQPLEVKFFCMNI